MAAQVFKRSFWYWDKCPDDLEIEEVEKEHEEAAAAAQGFTMEKQQQRSRKENLDTRSYSRSGVVVILGWMLSEPRHLALFTHLYKSLGWDCLVCHPHVLNLFFPSMATTLALRLLHELVKDLENHACPVVFASFSGGHKACLYKIIQIMLGQCKEVNDDKRKFKVVVESVVGLIFDSSPMEFESNIGAKVVSQQMLTFRPGRSNTIISHGAHALGRGLDIIFSKQFGLQRIDLWHALYSSVNMGPILILCSENDELAPLETIYMFSSNLRKLGGNVEVVTWKDSKHVGHFRRYPEQYSTEVKKLLINASSTYYDRLEKSRKHKDSLCTKINGGVRDSDVLIGTSAARWTDLPESVLSEITRMSRMPHVQLKGENIAPDGSVYSAVAVQNCSDSLEDANDGLTASHTNGCRSRL